MQDFNKIKSNNAKKCSEGPAAARAAARAAVRAAVRAAARAAVRAAAPPPCYCVRANVCIQKM